jgi:hypothetical protein
MLSKLRFGNAVKEFVIRGISWNAPKPEYMSYFSALN